MKLRRLFEPGRIGKMDIRNRLVMPPMQTRGADPDGFVTDRLIDYYAERAKGGAGLIIVQQSFAWAEGKLARGIALWDDRYIPGLRDLAHTVQSYGARIAIQLGSRGTMQDKGLEAVAPSPMPTSWREDLPRRLGRRPFVFWRSKTFLLRRSTSTRRYLPIPRFSTMR